MPGQGEAAALGKEVKLLQERGIVASESEGPVSASLLADQAQGSERATSCPVITKTRTLPCA
jgi:hypothetical protein